MGVLSLGYYSGHSWILFSFPVLHTQVVFTLDEVDFVQNLVYYVERAYRIPDFGMWERGSRDNVGKRELHSRWAWSAIEFVVE